MAIQLSRRVLALRSLAIGCCLAAALLLALVYSRVERPPTELSAPLSPQTKSQIRDRFGAPLSYTFSNGFNYSDYTPLHLVPPTLIRAFIEAEDQRFYSHSGVDWIARLNAVYQNISELRIVRGASTISEQVARMLHPRPRSLINRIVEGLEAKRIEERFSKAEILEFYLNQIPYAAQRRGIAQAARYFWNRDLTTLSDWEYLALAVMVRAPERLNLYRNLHGINQSVDLLARRMISLGSLSEEEYLSSSQHRLPLSKATLPVRAEHFARYILSELTIKPNSGVVSTTIDPSIQSRSQAILEGIINGLTNHNVTDGAMLVVDNATAEVLAWVNARDFNHSEGGQIDAVITPRQPGSTLKPLLYALSIEKGWTAATIINDTPLSEPVGYGLHDYRNFSRRHYGAITLRQALGNSLNIPAIKTVEYVGKESFLKLLRLAGFDSLTRPVEHYGEGLALGNGEVTLLELVRAYLALASRGVLRPLVTQTNDLNHSIQNTTKLLSPATTSIISNILSDSQARANEFGADSLLNFPTQTAVKTGTSTDFRDAWAIAYSESLTIGVWMGNLNRSSMNEVSGARGPAMVLRAAFAEFERMRETKPLYIQPNLSRISICPLSGALPAANCPMVNELFVKGSEPSSTCSSLHSERERGDTEPIAEVAGDQRDPLKPLSITIPTPGLKLARDPRIPDHLEALRFQIATGEAFDFFEWILDGSVIARTDGQNPSHLWSLITGRHSLKVRGRLKNSGMELYSEEVTFSVSAGS